MEMKEVDIRISGGTIRVYGKKGTLYTGIGSGQNGAGGTIEISGGDVYASETRIGEDQGGTTGTVSLTWTDKTKGSMRVFASEYSGNVTLQRAFYNMADMTDVFLPGKPGKIENKTIVPCERIRIYSWKVLQAATSA